MRHFGGNQSFLDDIDLREPILRAMFLAAGDALIAADAEGIIRYFNPAAERIFGYDAGEIIGRKLNDLMPSPHREHHDEYIRRYERTGDPHIIGIGRELEGVRKDGTRFPMYLNVTDTGLTKLRLFVGVVRDITDRKKVERRLEEQEERFRRGQLYADIGTWDWDLESGELYCTERVGPLFGFAPGDMVTSSENFLARVHPQDRKNVRAAIDAALERDVAFDFEHRVVWPDGTVRWLLERGAVVRDARGKPVHVLGVVQDIDERKRAELTLIAMREQAERANRARAEFISHMSHELRTPLNAILGFAQLLKSDSSTGSVHTECVGEILNAGNHLLELINDTLDMARIDAGKLKLDPETVSVDEILAETIALVSTMAGEHRVSITHRRWPGVFLYADRVRTRQVLINILTNAIKYNDPEGMVSIACSLDRNDQVCITVTDTGPGLTEEQLSAIFEPYNRLGREKSPVEGSGIGLAFSHKLVALMGGCMDVSSQVGEGTTFWIWLPLSTITTEEARAAMREEPDPSVYPLEE